MQDTVSCWKVSDEYLDLCGTWEDDKNFSHYPNCSDILTSYHTYFNIGTRLYNDVPEMCELNGKQCRPWMKDQTLFSGNCQDNHSFW